MYHSVKQYLTVERVTVGVLMIAAFVLIALKFELWGYSFRKILPKSGYEVHYVFHLEGFEEAVNVRAYLPLSNKHQTITNEVNRSGAFNLKIDQTGSGREATWQNPSSTGDQMIRYSFRYLGKAQQYRLDSTLVIAGNYPPGFADYLAATPNIQVNHPFIEQIFQRYVGETTNAVEALQSIYEYTHSLEPRPFKGLTDALTAARLGEGSCNGKSRLFVALARKAGIPTRLVGGLILEPGRKKTSHQWVEAYAGGYWIPFDPLNGHFASLPSNYMELYRGDRFLFTHTANINFDYLFNIEKHLVANPSLVNELRFHPFNAYVAWQAFETIGIPLSLLKIIIMLPLGALIVAIFRNVIGLQTYGVFLPALIAVASRETGLFWGLLAYLMVVSIVGLIHYPLEKWGILYTPKMAIMLVGVVIAFMTLSIFGIRYNLQTVAYVTLFPIVLMTITAERFARTITEEGLRKAIQLTSQTMVVVAAAYFVMNSRTMETFFLAFPELFLVIIAINLILGRWIGLRITEYPRFRWLLR